MILFEKMVFGPIQSRRLGRSLGVNLLPEEMKICNFDCCYCECGWTKDVERLDFREYSLENIAAALQEKLKTLQLEGQGVDSITFSGNGEPTLHPDFPRIVDAVIALRDTYYPKALTTVITNATRLAVPDVFDALHRVDKALLKLDAGNPDLFRRINRPKNDLHYESWLEPILRFGPHAIVQSLFLRGTVDNKSVDNTTEEYLQQWMEIVKKIKPKEVMIYSLDRDTPARHLEKVSLEDLNKVAERLALNGIQSSVYG